jgi:hypothetical protein
VASLICLLGDNPSLPVAVGFIAAVGAGRYQYVDTGLLRFLPVFQGRPQQSTPLWVTRRIPVSATLSGQGRTTYRCRGARLAITPVDQRPMVNLPQRQLAHDFLLRGQRCRSHQLSGLPPEVRDKSYA